MGATLLTRGPGRERGVDARDGIRTRRLLRAADFKSADFASLSTRAGRSYRRLVPETGLGPGPSKSQLRRCYGVFKAEAQSLTTHGGLRPHTFEQRPGPARAVAAAAPAVGRAVGRTHPPRPARGVRDALRPLSVAPAVLLPAHARLARGRRGRPPGGVRRRLP